MCSFKEFVKNSDGKIVILNQHNQRDPIGVADVLQDSKGVAFKGQLVMDAPNARTAYSLMKAKALSGMSMGYDVLAGGSEIKTSGVRLLKSLKMWEISPVTFGMNPKAGITGVKEIITSGRMPTLSEFEDFLCEAGFSRTQAKAVAGSGLRKLLNQREADENDATSDIAKLLTSFSLNPASH